MLLAWDNTAYGKGAFFMHKLHVHIWMTASQRRTAGFLCYLLLILTGCMVGVICTQIGTCSALRTFCTRYGMQFPDAEGDFGFVSAIFRSGGALLLSGCLGLSAIGQPFLCILLLLQGFSIGCQRTQAALPETVPHMLHAACGAAYAVCVSFFLLLGVREAVRLSCLSARIWMQGADAQEMQKRIRLYAVRFAVLLLLLLVTIGIYAALCFAFQSIQ
jgi:hypothetical protein